MPKALPVVVPKASQGSVLHRRVEIHRSQVKYFYCPKKRKWKLDIKNPPILPPRPNLVFKRYEFSEDFQRVFAHFSAWHPPHAPGAPGSRSYRPSGGENRHIEDLSSHLYLYPHRGRRKHAMRSAT